jgi:LmbE family N-acetylglucosaminyl deacetylase
VTGSRLLRPSIGPALRGSSQPSARRGRRRLLAGLVVLAASVMTFGVSGTASAVGCSASSVNIAAHPDDDLFFMNPAVLQTIANGGCSTTVYVTSGDAGGADSYYLGREAGVEAAYAQMAGVSSQWTTTRVTVGGKSVTRATLTGNPGIQLYFLRLPDGYVDGAGSVRSDYRSLEQLELGSTDSLQTLDAPVQTYTRRQLVSTLGAIIASATPTVVRTLDDLGAYGDGDHSDHHAVGRLAKNARDQYAAAVPFTGYLGYTTSALPANVSGSELHAKEDAFFAYAPYDPGSCLSEEECAYGSSGDWLVRQHTNTDTPTATEPTVPTGTNVAGSAAVTASSENAADGQTAVKAVDGVVDGYPGDHTAEWVSQGEGAGSWLQLTWASAVELNGVVLYDRPNEYDQVTGATLTFSDGSTVSVPSLDNAGGARTVTFPARSTSSLRITVTSVAAYTSNAGLAEVQAWGTAPTATEPTTGPQSTTSGTGASSAPASGTTSEPGSENPSTGGATSAGAVTGEPTEPTEPNTAAVPSAPAPASDQPDGRLQETDAPTTE